MFQSPITNRACTGRQFADKASEQFAEHEAFSHMMDGAPETNDMTMALLQEIRLGFGKNAEIDLALCKYLKAQSKPHEAWDEALADLTRIERVIVRKGLIPGLARDQHEELVCKYIARFLRRIGRLWNSLYRVKPDCDDYRPYDSTCAQCGTEYYGWTTTKDICLDCSLANGINQLNLRQCLQALSQLPS